MSLDRRARRTRRLLAEAILDLAQERDLDTIKITDITERADVSRVTFYDHYRGRDDLLVAALADTLDEITGTARLTAETPHKAHPPHDPPEHIRMLFRHIGARVGLYRRMLGPQGSARFADTLRTRITDAIREDLKRPGVLADVPVNVLADYLGGALIGVIHGYVHADPLPPPDEAARAVWTIYRTSWPENECL